MLPTLTPAAQKAIRASLTPADLDRYRMRSAPVPPPPPGQPGIRRAPSLQPPGERFGLPPDQAPPGEPGRGGRA
jgi:hypothetical protein